MEAIRIGYQGDEGSNAQAAAKVFGDRLVGDAWIEYVPLTTAEKVFKALQNGVISLGVVAINNSMGGVVSETRHMIDHAGIGGWQVSSIDEYVLPIHHCLFTASPDDEINHIASHEQALKQTQAYRAENYPDADEVETIDAAYAAEMMANGVFAPDVAVICRKDAGERLGLCLREENIEDGVSYTTFHLLQGPRDAEEEEEKFHVHPLVNNDDTFEVIDGIDPKSGE